MSPSPSSTKGKRSLTSNRRKVWSNKSAHAMWEWRLNTSGTPPASKQTRPLVQIRRLVLQPRLRCLRRLLTRRGALPARAGWTETRPLPHVCSPQLLCKREMLCTQRWCLVVSTARTGFHPDGCSSLLHKASLSYMRVTDQLTELLCNRAVTPWHRLAVSLGLLQHYAVFFHRDDRFSCWFNIFFQSTLSV